MDDNKIEDAIRKVFPPSYDVPAEDDAVIIWVDEGDGVQATIYNMGPKRKMAKIIYYNALGGEEAKPLLLVRGRFAISSVVKMGLEYGVKLKLDRQSFNLTAGAAVQLFRNEFFLKPDQAQKLMQVISAYINAYVEKGNVENLSISPVGVDDGKINVDFGGLDNKNILSSILQYVPFSTHPDAFVGLFGWSVLAPLHFALKNISESIIQPPLMLFQGSPKGGKSSIANLFLGRGFSMPKNKFYLGAERVRTTATLNVHLNESNLPALIDDVKVSWIVKNKDNFKSYVQTGIFADRGKPNAIEINEFRGLRSFVMTSNDHYGGDVDQATANRMLIFDFNIYNVEREDKKKFSDFFASLPKGFLISLIKELFSGKNIDEIYHDIEIFDSPEEWVNYGIRLINSLCSAYNLSQFFYIKSKNAFDYSSNAFEVFQAYLSEWDRLEASLKNRSILGEGIQLQTYRSKIETEFKIEEEKGRIFLYFTPSSFKTLEMMQGLKLPYESATDFISNVQSTDRLRVEHNGMLKSVRLSGYPRHCFVLSIPNDDAGTQAAFSDTPIMPPTPPHLTPPAENSKKMGTHYYMVARNWPDYDVDFFMGSQFILESRRVIFKGDTTSIAYVLCHLLIPEKIEAAPAGWAHFLSDSEEISQKAYEMLSKGAKI